MKNDADTHRKGLGMKPKDCLKISISNREEMVEFLNGICQGKFTPAGNQRVPEEWKTVASRVDVDDDRVPDYVPRFLLSQEQRKQREAR
ncbi:hypothetical protein [uncultured Paraglaciecola sp.]|uniref:hypothetical protein n=1 Tax=uncultured Paraglaciecola sp. TaxID=1765024 RepID=UPI00261D02AC|nr:hypothetical protein [uncultured Paraglaciecola sp.]